MRKAFNCFSLVPTITAFIAFILGVLCLFSGSKTNFLTGNDILTLYTPIGNDTAIHDFYSIYVMSYCEGYLGNGGPGVNMTSCSSHDMLFSFDPATVLERESGNHTSLSMLGWPSAISDDFQTFSITTKSMGLFYCVGAGIAGITILVRFGLSVSRKSRQSILEAAALFLGFISFSIASIIATVLSFQFVHLVNSHGRASNVTAKYGQQFLGMTWAAVGMLLMGSIASLVIVLVDHDRSRGYAPPVDHDDSSSSINHEPDETHEPKGADARSESDHLTKEAG